MSVSAIGQTSMTYGKIASGKRVNSAADDAAGLAIVNIMKKDANGWTVGAANIKDGVGVANIKDGALSTMQDSLQRIRELSLSAANGINGASEKQMIQNEIDQVLQGIEQTAVGTRYNEMKLMDGSMADMQIASSPDGTGMKIQMENVTLQELGIAGYDVTGSFDIGKIDAAMEAISASRSSTGAVTNAMEHAYNSNTITALELTGAQSRIEDLDMPKAISEQKKVKLLEDYRMEMIKKKTENDSLVVKMFGTM